MTDAIKSIQFQQITGYPFYNTSNFTLKTLVENPNQINKNFENYLNGFSENIREEIIGKFKFEDQLKRLKEKDLLYIVLQEFVSEIFTINIFLNKYYLQLWLQFYYLQSLQL